MEFDFQSDFQYYPFNQPIKATFRVFDTNGEFRGFQQTWVIGYHLGTEDGHPVVIYVDCHNEGHENLVAFGEWNDDPKARVARFVPLNKIVAKGDK